MAGPVKSTRSSALQRGAPARRHDPDQTDPGASILDDDDERTVAGDVEEVGEDDELVVAAASGDKTQVYDASAAARPEAASFKLVVLAGPKAGAEFELAENVMTLGRAADNHISIPDVSVSRKHVRFTRLGDEGYTVEDLGSGNGTRVNGDTLTAPAAVKHGDEISVGDTVVQLVELGVPAVKKRPAKTPQAPSGLMANGSAPTRGELPKVTAPPAPAPAPSGLTPQKKKLYGALAAMLGLVLLFGIAKKLKHPAQPADDGQAAVDYTEQLDEARKLMRAGKWIEAEQALHDAAQDSDDQKLVDTYEKVSREAGEQKKLRQAQKALESGDFASARLTALGIADKSAVFDDAQAFLKSVDAAVAKAANEAKDALSAGDKDRAAALVARVLAADAQNPLALAVKADLEKKAGKKDVVAASGTRRKDDVKVAAKTEEDPAPAPTRSSQALSLYLGGDLGKALRAAEESNDPNLKSLRTLDAAFRDGVAKAQANRSAEAVKSLGIAARADREISKGKPSKVGQEIAQALGNQEYLLGLDCKGDEQLGRQAQHFQAAIDADASKDLYKKAYEKTIAKCMDLYTQGYVARGTAPDEAKKLFKVVCECLPASHEKHERACNFYTQLGGGK